jgi:hypothetical protein
LSLKEIAKRKKPKERRWANLIVVDFEEGRKDYSLKLKIKKEAKK